MKQTLGVLMLWLGLGLGLWSQSNDAAVYLTGNLNPWYEVNLAHGAQPIIGSNKSSVGGGAEYRHYWGNLSAGLLYSQNPSDLKLIVPVGCCSLLQSEFYISPLMRFDVAALISYRRMAGRLTTFLQFGPGWVITDGYSNCGMSEDFAVVTGFGADYRLSKRWQFRAAESFLNTRQGCYGDPTCSERHILIQDLRTGPTFAF